MRSSVESGTASSAARRFGRVSAIVLGVAFVAAACGSEPTTTEPPSDADAPSDLPRLLERLGDKHFPVSTEVELAQRYFDQGLVLTYGFNHHAAIESFAAATQLDPDCAMCFWGVAYALGPNINAPMGPDAAAQAYAAVQEAVKRAPDATPRERAYIEALATRYAAEPPEDRAALDLAYANAMREVRTAYPDDVDAAVLAAEALMDLYPWDYYDDSAEPREYTDEIVELLESAIEREPTHVGANHFYIHAVEEFYPEKGVTAADRLGDLAPDAGHLVHMPSHIFWRVGRYEDALEINQRAAAADEQYFSWCQPGAFYRAAYYPHNVHFLWAAAATEGRSELALTSARKLSAETREALEEMDFLQEFQSVPILTLVRFGRWDAVLGEPKPDERWTYLVGIWHYARGLARVRKGELDLASGELEALRAITDLESMQALVLAGGTAPASDLLEIAFAHLEGELALARGEGEAAVAALERAVELQDALVYMEPPPWYFPTRQALGVALLEAGQPEAAEAVYRKDLEQYPKNGWSLFGLSQSLAAQNRPDDAAIAERGFASAWERADVTLTRSRF